VTVILRIRIQQAPTTLHHRQPTALPIPTTLHPRQQTPLPQQLPTAPHHRQSTALPVSTRLHPRQLTALVRLRPILQSRLCLSANHRYICSILCCPLQVLNFYQACQAPSTSVRRRAPPSPFRLLLASWWNAIKPTRHRQLRKRLSIDDFPNRLFLGYTGTQSINANIYETVGLVRPGLTSGADGELGAGIYVTDDWEM
jgi:hypothetical protein